MIDAYQIYCEWQRKRGQPVPTREWWDAACSSPRTPDHRSADQLEIDRESRDGWAYP